MQWDTIIMENVPWAMIYDYGIISDPGGESKFDELDVGYDFIRDWAAPVEAIVAAVNLAKRSGSEGWQ
jgi:hypothetical protein